MNLKPSFQAVRSIGVTFASRLYKPVVIVYCIVAAILLGLSIWLATIDPLWLILLVFVVFILFIVGGLLVAGLFIIKRVAPVQTKAQKLQSKQLADKLMRLAEVTGTPKIVLLFNVVKDVVAPSDKGYIISLSNDTTSIKRDFIALRNSFDQKYL
jgi:hypothetical protein